MTGRHSRLGDCKARLRSRHRRQVAHAQDLQTDRGFLSRPLWTVRWLGADNAVCCGFVVVPVPPSCCHAQDPNAGQKEDTWQRQEKSEWWHSGRGHGLQDEKEYRVPNTNHGGDAEGRMQGARPARQWCATTQQLFMRASLSLRRTWPTLPTRVTMCVGACDASAPVPEKNETKRAAAGTKATLEARLAAATTRGGADRASVKPLSSSTAPKVHAAKAKRAIALSKAKVAGADAASGARPSVSAKRKRASKRAIAESEDDIGHRGKKPATKADNMSNMTERQQVQYLRSLQ